MARKAPIRVAIADDQPLLRQGIRMIVDSQRDMTVVGEASDGGQVLALARSTVADVVLMDIQMPRMNGIVAAARLATDAAVRQLGRAPRVILMTAIDVEDHLAEAATVGVFAVMYKDVPPDGLLAAIREAAASDGL
ncbi:MAG: response regulator transcription factor [Actinomycetota bacterium]